MATFRYTALSDGTPSSGTIEASDRSDALRLLAARGEIVTDLTSAESESKAKRRSKARSGPSLSKAELAAFVRDLATAIDAGLPLMQALSVMQKQAADKRQSAILAHLIEKVEAGESLWAAAQSWGAPFDDMVVGMMRAADASGRMNEVLMQLADLLDRSVELRREVAGATIYPSMVFALLVASVAVFVTFVVPGLIDPLIGMDGFEIPGPTKLLLAIADFVSNWWLILTIGSIAAVFGFRTWVSVPANRLLMDRLLLQVPLLGKLQRVTGEGGSDGDVRGFAVTDFSDQNHIRVLTQDGAESGGKGQATFGVHWHLVDPGEFIFHRVFNGDDLFAGVVQLGQTRIQRGRLTRTGWPSHKDHAVWLGNHPIHGVTVVLGHAQALEIKRQRTLVQDPHHHGLSVQGGDG